MKGKYKVLIENNKIRYEFEIKRNITIIKGDSGTGKTSLIRMISAFNKDKKSSGVKIESKIPCRVLDGADWKAVLDTVQSSLVFVDEGNYFIKSGEFSEAIKNTNNYYIFIIRDSINTLPYSVNEIYGIRKKKDSSKKTVNEFYKLYDIKPRKIHPDKIITEDSNSGFQFFDHLARKYEMGCKSSKGKSNIYHIVMDHNKENLLIIADGAAFGSEIEKINLLLKNKENISLYLPESFEHLLLESDVLEEKEVLNILKEPFKYIESSEFFSWERFFTHLLIEKSEGSEKEYSKKYLNTFYLKNEMVEKVMKNMKFLEL